MEAEEALALNSDDLQAATREHVYVEFTNGFLTRMNPKIAKILESRGEFRILTDEERDAIRETLLAMSTESRVIAPIVSNRDG